MVCLNIKNIVLATIISVISLSDPVSAAKKPKFNALQESCPAVNNLDRCRLPDNGRLVLALQWNTDISEKLWTIHGFWPGHCNNDREVKNCDDNRRVGSVGDLLVREPGLEDDLLKYWPSAESMNNQRSFWANEFAKHGTCVSTYHPDCTPNSKPGDDALKYWKDTVRIAKKYDIYDMLDKHAKVPGNRYTKTSIADALKAEGLQPKLRCIGDSLKEIRITFYVDGLGNYTPQPELPGASCPAQVMYLRKRAGAGNSNPRNNPPPAVVRPAPGGGANVKLNPQAPIFQPRRP